MAQVTITLNVDVANITELNKNTVCSLTGPGTTTPDKGNITNASLRLILMTQLFGLVFPVSIMF